MKTTEQQKQQEQPEQPEYRIRLADNKIQYYVEQDINYLLSSLPEEKNSSLPNWKIIDVKYSKNKARESMYRFIKQHKNHETTIL